MPELFRMFGMKFFFFSLEHKPVHIHVRNADGKAKFNIMPEISLVEALIIERKEEIIKKWNEIHGE